jgi:propanediol dehydratase large subunit
MLLMAGPRADLLALLGGCTPAKLLDVVGKLNAANARFIRQAAEAHRAGGLLRPAAPPPQ